MTSNINHGFSKLSREEKLEILLKNKFIADEHLQLISDLEVKNQDIQGVLNSISENSIANYTLPLSIVPNVLINDEQYFVPVVVEESSVVAAASYSAKFWATHGGFHTKVLGETKIGQIHFLWNGQFNELYSIFDELKQCLQESIVDVAENMTKRGGGVKEFELIDFSEQLENYYQLKISFETADAMGANFINTCLEHMADAIKDFIGQKFTREKSECEIIMAILSNYTPECITECIVECPKDELKAIAGNLEINHFIKKFENAVQIATIDPYRAVTHNKGIFNGLDAVVHATGNDFRAVEACGHAYASRNGKYTSLSWCENDSKYFRFKLKIPFALGTVGGLTKLHPGARLALQILKNPSADQLMQIAIAIGMSNHFAAIRALITDGLQKGHMKMHLTKMLSQLSATHEQVELVTKYFKNRQISYHSVSSFLSNITT
jgi:hydroxymethylglutaryl-CoA reductase